MKRWKFFYNLPYYQEANRKDERKGEVGSHVSSEILVNSSRIFYPTYHVPF